MAQSQDERLSVEELLNDSCHPSSAVFYDEHFKWESFCETSTEKGLMFGNDRGETVTGAGLEDFSVFKQEIIDRVR